MSIPFSEYVRKHPAAMMCKYCGHRLVFNAENSTWHHMRKQLANSCETPEPKIESLSQKNSRKTPYAVITTEALYKRALSCGTLRATHLLNEDGNLLCKSFIKGKKATIPLLQPPRQCKQCIRHVRK